MTYPSDSWQTEHEDPEITIGGLKRDTNYRIDIRARLRHRECGNHIFYGAYSDRVYFQTNKTSKLMYSFSITDSPYSPSKIHALYTCIYSYCMISFVSVGKQSNITLRLVPSRPDIDFMGRLEVLHDNQWGTICDDNFGVSEANIACHMLNFTGGLCLGNFGQGQGMCDA